jgi:hypothetical protein
LIAEQSRPTTVEIGWVLPIAALVVLVDQARIVWSAGRSFVTSDATTIWVAARDWAHLSVHQPNFYGQGYGSTFEAIPIAVLHGLGLDFWTANPLTLATMSLAGWALLAFVAVRRAHPLLAVAAIVAPALFSAYYAVFVSTAPVSPAPRLLALVGAAMLLVQPRRPAVEVLAWTFLGFAAVLDAGTAVLSVPVAAWFLLIEKDVRTHLPRIAVGAIVPVAWLAFCAVFYAWHPDELFHPGVSTRPRLSILRRTSGNPSPLFSLYRPELVRSWIVPVVIAVVLVALCIATRQRAYVVPALLMGAIVLWGMATPRAVDNLEFALPPGRVLLTLPYACWVLALFAAEGGIVPRRVAIVLITAVVCVAAASVALRAVFFDSRVLATRDAMVRASYQYTVVDRPRVLAQQCRARANEARAEGVRVVVYVADNAAPFGCSALGYEGVDGLLPSTEKRTWLLYRERNTISSAAVIASAPPNLCRDAARAGTDCVLLPGGDADLRFPPKSLLAELKEIGVLVRPFGPDCHLVGPADLLRTCAHPLP